MKNTDIQNHEIQIENMFDKIAPRYDFLNGLLSAKQDQAWRNVLVKELLKNKHSAYLDVATGTGDVLLTAAKKTNFSRLAGVDVSEVMLQRAKQKGKEIQQKIEWQKMSASSLAFEDASFDCLSISFGFRNVSRQDQALSEFHRVLKDDSHLYILEFFKSPNRILSSLFKFYFNNILPVIGGLFSDKKAYEYLPKSVDNFLSAKEFIKTLNKSGFSCEKQINFLWGSCSLLVLKKV